MKFSELWLREWVNPAISSDDLAHQITMAGLEVDGVDAVAGELTALLWVMSWSVGNIQMQISCE